jgi:hypothetical protein
MTYYSNTRACRLSGSAFLTPQILEPPPSQLGVRSRGETFNHCYGCLAALLRIFVQCFPKLIIRTLCRLRGSLGMKSFPFLAGE